MDVVAGNGPPPILVSELVQGLPDESLTVAMKRGGPQFLGWGADRYIAAATFDAINANTVVSGNWKKKPPTPTPYPRPSVKKAVEKTKASVASLYAAMNKKLGAK